MTLFLSSMIFFLSISDDLMAIFDVVRVICSDWI